MGSILNKHSRMNTEIAERIVKGNKAYYANANANANANAQL